MTLPEDSALGVIKDTHVLNYENGSCGITSTNIMQLHLLWYKWMLPDVASLHTRWNKNRRTDNGNM